MKTAYQSDLVDLKVVETESNGEVFYQVWNNGNIYKQSNIYEVCLDFINTLLPVMIDKKLEDLKADVYYAGIAYVLSSDDKTNLTTGINLNEAHKALNEFKDKVKGVML